MTDNLRLQPAKAVAVLVCLFLASAVPALAHKGHHPSPSPSPAAAPSALPAAPGAANTAPGVAVTPALPGPAAKPPASPAPAAAKKPFAIDWRAAVFEHMHNKLIHFPIALGIAAAVLILVTPRWPHFDQASQVLLLAAALFAIAAYFTGSAQLADFKNTPLHDTGELHEKLGIATAVLLWVGVVLARVKAAKRWLWVYAVLLILLISTTGLVGGVLAHTEY